MDTTIQNHTVKSYDGELNHIHHLALEMGDMVLGQLRSALLAFEHRDLTLARQVVESDKSVDQMEVRTDDEISRLLARRCPVSADLRLVIAVSKSVSDLERIGDEAVRIAGLVIDFFDHPTWDINSPMMRNVRRMGAMAVSGLQAAMDLFETWNDEKAAWIIDNHRQMDEEFTADLRHLLTYILEDYRTIGHAISVLLTIKALERIGHHAQNIAEYVILKVKGEDIRHRQP